MTPDQSSGELRDAQEIRHQNLRFLLEECAAQHGCARGAVAHLARACEIKPSLLSMLLNRVAHSTTGKARLVGDDTATKLEVGMCKPRGWLDVDRSIARNFNEAALLDRLRTLSATQIKAVEQIVSEFCGAHALGLDAGHARLEIVVKNGARSD